MESEFRKEEWDVRGIAADDAKEWVLYKHYAHRLPSITYAFGLYRIGGGAKRLIIRRLHFRPPRRFHAR